MDRYPPLSDRRALEWRAEDGKAHTETATEQGDLMHAIPWQTDNLTPCNARCQGDIHVDVTYDTPARMAGWPSLTAHLWHTLTWNGTVEVLAIQPAPEALPVDQRYTDPYTAQMLAAVGVPPEEWQAFRVTYRVHQPPQGTEESATP
jgi:hypothetical protein